MDEFGEVFPQHMVNGIPSTRNLGRGNLKIFPNNLFVLNGIMWPKRRQPCPYWADCLYISNKVCQHADGARKDASKLDVKQHIGTSRAGQNTKIHALINDELEIVAYELTGGQVLK